MLVVLVVVVQRPGEGGLLMTGCLGRRATRLRWGGWEAILTCVGGSWLLMWGLGCWDGGWFVVYGGGRWPGFKVRFVLGACWWWVWDFANAVDAVSRRERMSIPSSSHTALHDLI